MSNPARPAAGAPLTPAIRVPDGGAIPLHFRADGRFFSMIVTRRGADLFAFENACPHAGNRFDEMYGSVIVEKKSYVLCPHHGASFDLASGACLGGPSEGGLTPIAIVVEDGVVKMA
ncbi:MAG: Rieske 2Fe-2S domain-containing protein [Alphaproteobacteria bacterium]|nr:Rieske 2Fe-2S domain-containing protein [Alphaproteobacteria bacterium]